MGYTLINITSWCDTLICGVSEPNPRSLEQWHYLLIALHQLKRLALDILATTDNVGEDRREALAINFGFRNSDIELASVVVLELKLNIELLCDCQ
jgi:hypothetical protein